MARSALFRALRRFGRSPRRERTDGWSRRQFIQALGVAATLPAIGGCGNGGGRRIAIVGGGMAGLTAAHVLALAGVRAEVYEASLRTGGRMYTLRGLPGDQLVELGGELVD